MDGTPTQDPWAGLGAPAGQCRTCVHAHLTATARGTTYLRCLRARTDPHFARHPRLPVLLCPGYEPPTEAGS